MGLAEPRKRIKLAHDPRNLQWSDNASSFGARIMQSSGWKPGTALGASSIPIPAHESSAAKVRISVKDDMLGLGASLKSKNIEHQRTGLDAFQGLLGRLNARDEGELKKVEEKIENRKLAMFAQGRWGGMVFVPGGLLVQDDPSKHIPIEDENQESEAKADIERNESDSEADSDSVRKRKPEKRKRAGETSEERAQRKAEKRQRKEERRIHKEAKRLKKLQTASGTSTPLTETTELTETTSTGASTPVQLSDVNVSSVTRERLQNGRHVLRGRNIQAKRMAFTDSKGLDQIFMRQQQQQAA